MKNHDVKVRVAEYGSKDRGKTILASYFLMKNFVP